jgi:hypothetical protein
MKVKLQELRQIIFNRLPSRWGVQSKVQQITHSASQLYEFKLPGVKPGHAKLNEIRQFILMNPYVVPTRPVHFKSIQSESESSGLSISFTVMNPAQGIKIEKSIRRQFHLPDLPVN